MLSPTGPQRLCHRAGSGVRQLGHSTRAAHGPIRGLNYVHDQAMVVPRRLTNAPAAKPATPASAGCCFSIKIRRSLRGFVEAATAGYARHRPPPGPAAMGVSRSRAWSRRREPPRRDDPTLPYSDLHRWQSTSPGFRPACILHAATLAALMPFPASLWLDYVDHWVFMQLRRRALSVVAFEACLQHELSVSDLRTLTARRLTSVLDGEASFVALLGPLARLAYPLRLLSRALRYYGPRRDLARHLIRWAGRRLKGRPMTETLFTVTLLELFIGGGGRLLEVGPATVRMILFALCLCASVLIALHQPRRHDGVPLALGLVAAYLVIHVGALMHGVINGHDAGDGMLELQQSLYWLAAPFMAAVLQSQRMVVRAADLIRVSGSCWRSVTSASSSDLPGCDRLPEPVCPARRDRRVLLPQRGLLFLQGVFVPLHRGDLSPRPALQVFILGFDARGCSPGDDTHPRTRPRHLYRCVDAAGVLAPLAVARHRFSRRDRSGVLPLVLSAVGG